MESSQSPGHSADYAGFWKRGFASSIDELVLTAASWVAELMLLGAIYWVKYLFRGAGEELSSFSDEFNPFYLQIINMFIYALMAGAYYVVGHYRYGTTLGKRVFRIYVVDAKAHGPITLNQSWTRLFGYLVSTIPLGAGYLMAAFHPQKRSLHDLMAGTVCVIKPKLEDRT